MFRFWPRNMTASAFLTSGLNDQYLKFQNRIKNSPDIRIHRIRIPPLLRHRQLASRSTFEVLNLRLGHKIYDLCHTFLHDERAPKPMFLRQSSMNRQNHTKFPQEHRFWDLDTVQFLVTNSRLWPKSIGPSILSDYLADAGVKNESKHLLCLYRLWPKSIGLSTLSDYLADAGVKNESKHLLCL